MKKLIIGICISIMGFSAYSQTPDCSSFRTGKFQSKNGELKNTTIKRTEKYQFEKQGREKVKLRVVWEDACTYRLVFVKANAALSKELKRREDVFVRIVETDKDSYKWEAWNEEGPEDLLKGIYFKVK